MSRIMLATIVLVLTRGVAVAEESGRPPACEPDRPVAMEAIPLTTDALVLPIAVESDEPDSPGADEATIREAVKSYVEAFNRADAEAVAAYWREDGQFATPSGETFQGREAIREGYETFFTENQGVRIEVDVASIQMETSDLAVEEGTARVIRPGEPPTETRYVAIHTKEDGVWKMKSLREANPPPSHHEQLKELEWLIGRWGDQEEETSIATDCQWTRNKNFITRSFSVSIADQIELQGTQVIGWDPAEQVIRSWLFDSDGGFGVGIWTRDGDRWTIRMLQVLPDGERASSVNLLTRVDDDTFEWQSVNREVDGEVLPNIDPVTVVRRPSDSLTYQETR